MALAHLSRADPVLSRLIDRHGPPPPRRPVPGNQRFAQLVRAIVYQQLAGKAAAAIHARLLEAVGQPLTATAVLSTPEPELRSCGLSGAKCASILDLAAHAVGGDLDLEHLGRRSDEEVVAQLTVVRGVGPWTAQMFLMNTLGRPDVWPVGDLGVRVGFGKAWGLTEPPTPRELDTLGAPFRPYRTLVAWYCWQVANEG